MSGYKFTTALDTSWRVLFRYDLILDIHGGVDFSFDLLKKWNNSKFVTIKTPFLQNADDYGILPGLLRSGVNLTTNVLQVKFGFLC